MDNNVVIENNEHKIRKSVFKKSQLRQLLSQSLSNNVDKSITYAVAIAINIVNLEENLLSKDSLFLNS